MLPGPGVIMEGEQWPGVRKPDKRGGWIYGHWTGWSAFEKNTHG